MLALFPCIGQTRYDPLAQTSRSNSPNSANNPVIASDYSLSRKYHGMFKTEIRSLPFSSKRVFTSDARWLCRK